MDSGREPDAVAAVIFDLDGLIVESEEVWFDVRSAFAREHSREWRPDIQKAVMGMGPQEWPEHMKETLDLDLSPPEIRTEILRRIVEEYDKRVPVIPGAVEAVQRLSGRWPLALASSSDRVLIDEVLARLNLTKYFEVTVSSEEVERGKPAPDVYLEAARRMKVDPPSAVAVEDSANGIRSARSAGMAVIAIPNTRFPPSADALGLADVVLGSIGELTASEVERAGRLRSTRPAAALPAG